MIDGHTINVACEEADFSQYLGEVDYPTEYLVRYNIRTRKIFVDIDAPEWYKELAALHEMVCCGHRYERLIPALSYTNPNQRCACIEEFIIKHAGEHRQEYIEKRLAMFKSLLDNDLCATSFRTSVENTIAFLKHQR